MTYRLGALQGLAVLGLVKMSEETDKPLTGLQATAMGAAGASPFLGLIGEKPMIHDPVFGAKGTQFKSMKDLSAAAQPGDVLLTTKKKSPFKRFISPISGSEWYHAQPIVDRRRGHGTTISAGELDISGVKNPEKARGLIQELLESTDPAHREMARHGYEDVVLVRPKGLNKGQTDKFVRQSLLRSGKEYDMGHALKAWARDIFVPKVEALAGGAQTVCEGNVCSTVPSQALHEATGKRVIPGKPAQYTMPQDFLRSDQYELVGSRLKNRKELGGTALRLMPYASRAAIGAGLAGATYAATENPEYTGILPGAAAGSALGTHVYKQFRPNAKPYTPASNPSLSEALSTLFFDQEIPRQVVHKNFLKRRLPWLVGGGIAGGLATSYLTNKLRNKQQTP